MGVRGLSAFMRQYGGRASASPTDIRLLALAAIKRSGQARSTVCVDGNSLLYYLYEDAGLNWLLGGQFEQKVEEWLDAFESCGIGLVFFFDGLVDPLKRATSLERRSRDAKYATSVLHSLQERANTDGPPRVLLPILAAAAFVGTLQRRGVEMRFSNFEADRDIACYCTTHPECIGAVSQDSDFLIFDMGEACYVPLDSLQIKQASKPGKWTITCQTFRVDLTASMFNFDKKWMPIFASLVGNDYTREDTRLIKLYRQMNIIAGDNVGQIIRKIAKFLSRFRAEEKELDVYMYLMKYIRKEDRNHLHQVLKRSVNVYTITSEAPPTDVQVGHGGLAFKHDSGMNEALALEFRQGRLATQHMSVLADGEYWAGVSVVDPTLFDPGEIYLQLRATMYRALLGHQLEQSKASKKLQPGEQESGQPQSAGASAGSGKAQQQKKQPTKGGGPTLCVSELMQTQRSYRKRSTVTLKPGDAGGQILRYLLVEQNDSATLDGGGERLGRAEPLLYEWELNTYLLHLVRLQRKQPAAVKGADRKRFVCLVGLLQTGLLHALLLHQLCGHPLGLQLPPPSHYYDGFAFLREYCHRWDARRAERRLRGGAPSTPRQPRDEEQERERERTEEANKQDDDDAREELKLKEQVVEKEENDDKESDSTVLKAREAIVAGLRPHPDSAKQNERAGPSLFKPETTKQTNKKRRRKENNGGSGAREKEKEKERRDQDHGEEEGSDDQDADRLATHNSDEEKFVGLYLITKFIKAEPGQRCA
ncbi:uncharacterized protein ACA1_133390 [Acanthamoeba castellanii str. Neff]|uniref:Uncharacterized protein n=1 Tax=Acanthamoeba castellanii (strain ATCC 30010 / Neff) TaxID=1257118 RepID=L8H5S4_ACACF|nr:uncharacterized protein ACA1_133390 [Acanthamoeba castellanii str. Neff]ELR19826.1 hypothetical protein ACA1_133390 [Acanthamoeba castellanii str. Neff]